MYVLHRLITSLLNRKLCLTKYTSKLYMRMRMQLLRSFLIEFGISVNDDKIHVSFHSLKSSVGIHVVHKFDE